jgi:hypothetical protein
MDNKDIGKHSFDQLIKQKVTDTGLRSMTIKMLERTTIRYQSLLIKFFTFQESCLNPESHMCMSFQGVQEENNSWKPKRTELRFQLQRQDYLEFTAFPTS